MIVLAQDIGSSAGTRGVVIPVGNNAERPAGVDSEAGMLRYNTEDERTEIFDGTNWTSVAGSPQVVLVEMMQKQSHWRMY